MKRLLLLSVLLLTLVSGVSAQTTNPPTRFRRLAAAPNCTITGMVYFNTGTLKVQVCTVTGTPGTWVDQLGSGETLLAGNGTEALPSYSFTSDPDTGIYRVGANQIGFSTLGTKRASVSNGGFNLFAGGSLTFNGATSGAITFSVPATITGYGLTWPSAAPPTNEFGVLLVDSFGVLSWTNLYSKGTPGIAGNGTLNTNSKNSAGKITATGTGASTIVLTFSSAATFANAPACIVTNETTANLVRPISTTSTLTINATIVTGDSLAYICIGY